MHNPVFAFWDLSLHFSGSWSCIIFWIESSAAEASRELNVKLFERILFPLPGSPCPSLSCVILGILSPIGCGSYNPAAGQTPTHFIKHFIKHLPSSDGVVRGVLLVRRVGGGQVGGHAGQRLQGGVGGGHRASPIRFLIAEYTVGQAVHLTIS